MSANHTTHGTHPHHGPRDSASDRPLTTREPRTKWRARAWLWGSIAVVYGLATLAIVAPTATLTVLLGAAVAGATIWAMHRLADRGARSWGAELPGASRHASRDTADA